ncbi:MAG: type II toxin-antitoxin system VapC family toxin, partial [bacterium]|nr:type II toxin-antitoxin system VapC family toxin [bacterium]
MGGKSQLIEAHSPRDAWHLYLAILLDEPEAAAFARALASDSKRLTSAVSVLEAGIVIQSRKGPAGAR